MDNARRMELWKATQTDKNTPKEGNVRIPPEYGDFADLFEEKEHPLPERKPWDHEIPFVRHGISLDESLSPKQEMKATKLKPQRMYPLSQEQEEEVRRYLEENIRKG